MSWQLADRRYTRGMTTIPRILSTLALLSLLAACGNKGALIKPSQIPDQTPSGQSMPVPPETNPVDPAPQDQATTPATDEAEPVPVSADDGDDGNG